MASLVCPMASAMSCTLLPSANQTATAPIDRGLISPKAPACPLGENSPASP